MIRDIIGLQICNMASEKKIIKYLYVFPKNIYPTKYCQKYFWHKKKSSRHALDHTQSNSTIKTNLCIYNSTASPCSTFCLTDLFGFNFIEMCLYPVIVPDTLRLFLNLNNINSKIEHQILNLWQVFSHFHSYFFLNVWPDDDAMILLFFKKDDLNRNAFQRDLHQVWLTFQWNPLVHAF